MVSSLRKRTILAASIAVLCGFRATAPATTYTWDAGGAATTTWSTPTNWNPDAVPAFVAGDIFDLSMLNITANSVSTMDTSNTLGTIRIGDATTISNSWTLTGSGTLTLDGNGSAAMINSIATSKGDTVSVAGILLNSDLSLTNAATTAASTLTISSGITAGTSGLKAITNNGTGAAGTTLSGIIGDGSGTVSVQQNSATSFLTLSGNSSYSGGTTLANGTLKLGNASALGSGALTITGGTLDSTVANLTLSTNNVQNWNGNFAFAGTQNLNLGTGVVTLSANRQVTVSAATLTVGGGIGEASAGLTLTKAGAGNLVLNGNNTYTGGTTISGGVLTFGASSVVPATGAIIIANGGALAASGPAGLANFNQWLSSGKIATSSGGALAITANESADIDLATPGYNSLFLGSIGGVTYSGNLTPGTGGYHLGGGSGTLTVSSVLNAATTLTINGSVALTNANGYTGATTVAVGSTLNLQNSSALGSGAAGVTVNTTSAVGASLQLQGNITVTGKTLTAGGTASGQSGTLSNALENVSGNNTWAGSIVGDTTNGNVRFGADGGNLNISGTVTLSGGAGLSLVLTGSSTGTISNTISSSVGTTAIIKNGASIWTLSGNNNYTGVTRVDDGVLLLMSANALPGGIGATGGTSNLTFNLTSSVTVVGLGVGDFTRPLGTGASQVQWAATSNGGFAAFGANRIVNLGGASAGVTWGAGSFVGTGQLLILGATTADSTVDFQNPINFGTVARTVQVNDGTAAFDAKLSGNLTSGAGGGLTKAGAGALVLTGTNTYSGATTLSGGGLVLGSAGALSANSNLVISGGGYIGLSLGNFTLPLGTAAGAVQWTGSGGFAAFGGDRVVNLGGASAALTWGSGGFVPTASTLVLGATAADSMIDFQNPIDLAGAARTVQVDDGSAAIDAKLSGVIGSATAGSALTKTGAGTLLLSGNNSYVGLTTVSAGTIQLGNSNALGDIAGSTSIAASAVVDLNGQAIPAEAFSVTGSLLNNGGTAVTVSGLVTLGAAGTLGGSGDISITQGLAGGNVAFVKTGAGTVTLNADAATRTTSAATTTINGGTLVVKSNGALGTNGTGSTIAVTITTGTLEINGSGLVLDNGLSLNVSNGATIRSSGSNTTNARINVSSAVGANTVTIATVNASDVFSIGNGANDVSGGNGADDVIQISGPGTVRLTQADNYIGNWSLLSGSTTQLGATAAFGATPTATITLAGGATLAGRLTGATTFTANPITVSGTGAATLLFDRNGNGAGGYIYTFGTLTIGNQQLNVTNSAAVTSSTATIAVGAAGTASTLTGNATFNVDLGTGGATRMEFDIFGLNESGGSYGFTKNGSGFLVLASTGASYNYSGGVTLNAGGLILNKADALGTGTLTINGGTIDRNAGIGEVLTTNNAQFWNGDFTFVGTSALNLGVGSVTLGGNRTITVSALTLTEGGAIGDGGNGYGLTKAGAGVIILSGTSTYGGGTTISAGALRVSKLADGGNASGIGQSSNAASNLVLSGGRLAYTGTGDSTDRLFDLQATSTIESSGSGAVTFTNTGTETASGTASARTLTLSGYNTGANTIFGTIVNSGTSANVTSVTKNGSGTWVLAGTNSYTGATTLRGGSLIFDYSAAGNTSAPLATGSVVLDGGNVTLRGKSSGTTAKTVSSLTLGQVNGVAHGVTLDANGGSGVNLTVTTLAGITSNTLESTLIDLSSSAGNTITVTNSGSALTSSGTNGVLLNSTRANVIVRDSAGYGFATISGATVVANTSNINRMIGKLSSGTALTAGSTGNTSNFFYSTAGTLTRSADLDYQTLTVDSTAGAISIDFGAFNFAPSGTNGRGILVAGANDVSFLGTGNLGSSQWLFNYGTGTVSLSQALGTGGNLYSAGTGLTTYGGTISSSFATLNFIGGITRLTLDQVVSSAATSSGIWVGSGGVLELGADLNGATAGDFTTTVGIGNGQLRLFGDAGLSAYTTTPGGTRLANLGGGSALTWGSGAFLTASDGVTDGDFTLKLSSAKSDATIEVQNAIGLNGRDRVIEVANGSADLDAKLSGVISGNGVGFTKTGNGTLALSAANTYSGATNVSAGTLIVSGSLSGTSGGKVAAGATLNVAGTGSINAASSFQVSGTMNVVDSTTSAGVVTVNSGGALGGNGSVKTLTVASGGTVAPGNGLGALHAGSTILQSGGILKLDLSTDGTTGVAGTDWDTLAIDATGTSTLDLTGLSAGAPFTLKLEVAALPGWNTNGAYRWASIITTTGGLVANTFSTSLFAFDTTDFQNDTSGGFFRLEQSGNSLDLVYIPEPGSLLSLMGGLGLLLGLQRFRRRAVR